ncbi:MAG: GIY-YIG nuclease family protein [Cyclobacteriaceae bacterium]
MKKGGSVYILTNTHHSVFYVGVTSDLPSRLIEHRERVYPNSFTSRYNLFKLVYFENFFSIEEAIDREKYIKGKVRKYKISLISSMNPAWKDLGAEVLMW